MFLIGLNQQEVEVVVGEIIPDSEIGWFEGVVNKDLGYKLGINRNIQAFISGNKITENHLIEIHKNIKAGSGIGSSAASAAGAVFGINQLIGKPFSAHDLIQFAMEGEGLASGSPHADNVAPVLLGGFTLVRSMNPVDVIKLPCPSGLKAIVLHPKIELKTMHAREILKKNVSLKKAVTQWGNLAAFISALYTEDFDLMSRSLVDEIVEPMRSLLIPEFEKLKKAAMEAGALGFGISGSGPSVYALANGIKDTNAIADAMSGNINQVGIDFEIYTSTINNQGIKIISSK